MNPNKELWEKGDFSKVAQAMRVSSEDLVEELGINSTHTVLDLACGDGSTAIPSAQRGAQVLGIDIAENLVAAGRRRAENMGLQNITFEEGDACRLHHLKSHQFDFVVSMFGAMFAPCPNVVAATMVRVAKPGGTIVMGNWIPDDPTLASQILNVSKAYSPPPPEGFVSPMKWGVPSIVTERFVNAGIDASNVSCDVRQFKFYFPMPSHEVVQLFQIYFGPIVSAFAVAESRGETAKLVQDLTNLFTEQNQSSDPDTTEITANYLRVTVRC